MHSITFSNDSRMLCLLFVVGKPPIVRRKFTYWLTEILWSLIFRHYFDFKSFKMNRRATIDYHKASQSLIKWIKVKVPNCRINNIATDLRNGVLLCQLVNAVAPKTINPSLFADYANSEDVVVYAMEAAREVLGIPALINASDIADCKADEKSLITYLALFRSADRMLAKGIRPVSPRTIGFGKNTIMDDSKRGKHRNVAYGFGIRYGEVGKPTEFIVHIDPTNKSDVHISIKCTPEADDAPRVKAEPTLKSIGDCAYIISYTPVIAGYYEISVLCDMKHINNSPFKIRVKETKIEFKCYSESDNTISIEPNKRMSGDDFLIFSDDAQCLANHTDFDVADEIPYRPESLNTIDSGIESVLCNDNVNNDLLYVAENSERGSSVGTMASSPNCLSKGGSESSTFSDFDFFEAAGPGLDSGEVGVMSHFEVRTPNGSNGPLSVLVTCPAVSIPTPFVNTRQGGEQLVHDVMFLPTEPGTYEIELKWGNKLIASSPYNVVVTEAVENQARGTCAATDLENFLNEALKQEKEAVLYYSATSTDTRHARRCQYLESILRSEITNLNLERVAIDLEIPSDERRQLFSKINVKQNGIALPFVFLNHKFLGTFETIVGQHRKGVLKEYIDKEFDYLRTVEESNELIDFKTLREIKMTLSDLKSPLSLQN